MSEVKQFITVNSEVSLKVHGHLPVTTVITVVEEGVFWTRMPRSGNQVLVLQKGQVLSVRLPSPLGVLIADTSVVHIGSDHDKFYGLAVPDKYLISQQRKSIRAIYDTNVFFQAGSMEAETKLVNFSAGGIMVYMVPELSRILKKRSILTIYFSIDNTPYILDVRNAWVSCYNKVEYAGFTFYNIPGDVEHKINQLAIKYSLYLNEVDQ